MSRSHGLSRGAQGRVRKALLEQLEARHLLASDYLLVLDGVKGESKDASHPGAIEIQSFSWGASNPGRVASPLTTEEFRFVTNTSTASPLLYQAAAEGKHFTKAVLYGRKSGEGQQDYLKIELKDILISSYQTRSLNEELPKDEIAIDFSSITQEVTSTGADGKPVKTASSWSIPRRAETVSSDSLLSQQPSSNLDQSDAFLLLDGIAGDSTDKVYPNAIPIESFSWGVSQSSSRSGGSGRATFQDLHLVREIGKASPWLASAAATGKHFPDATLVVRRGSALDGANNFIKIKLSEVVVSSYSTAAGAGTSPMEEIQVSFGSILQSVSSESSDGGIVVSSKLSTRGADSSVSDDLIDNTIPAAASSDFLLEIDSIKGESSVTDHKGAIQLDSFSWGVSQTGSGGGGGGGSGKVSLQDFHFSSATGSASPLLLSSTATGKHIAKAVLTVRKSGEQPVDYIKIQLEDLLVSSYQAQGMNNQVPTDSVSLNFTKIAWVYQPASADGQAPAPIKTEWDVPRSADRVSNTVVPYITSSSAAGRSADYFLKFEGIDGESTNQDHKGEIEVLSWSWGIERSGITSSGSGLSAGKVSFQDFHFVASNSKASPKLYEKIFSNPSSNEVAKLYVRRAGTQDDYIKMELRQPNLSSMQVQSIDRSLPIEEYSADYLKIDMRYFAPSNGAVREPVVGSATVSSRADHKGGDALLSQTKSSPGAADYSLTIDGIQGESADASNPNSIDVQSFSWGVSQTSASSGSGGGTGKVSLQDIHFVMDSSSATPQVLRGLATGKHFTNVVLVSRTRGESPSNFLKIKLTDVLVSSYKTQGQAGSAPQDEVSLNFIKFESRVASADGAPPVSSSFDFSRLRNELEFDTGESILSISSPSTRSADYFLKIDGIKGESAEKAHKDWIDIQSFSWGATAQITNARRVRGIKFEGLSFGADTDSTSPQVLSAFARGNHIPTAQLEIAAPSGRNYLKYELKDVLISSYSLSGSESDDTDFSTSFGRLSVSASPPANSNAKGGDLSGESVDIYYTDQDEFVAGKRRR